MTPFHAILLGLVQGTTEWLPVSSSGHLVLFQKLLESEVPIFFDLVLHIATAIVVIVVFRRDIVDIFRSLARTLRLKKEGKSFETILLTERSSLLAWFIVLGSIPTAIIGFAFRDVIEPLFDNLFVISAALVITGIVLTLTLLPKRKKEFMNAQDALSVGIAQGISLIPGISRSGFTIATGMLGGVDRQLAARYSFLLSVPAILGAATFELLEVISSQTFPDPFPLALAFLSSLLFGYLSIKALWFIVTRAKLHYFSVYCFLIGGAILLHTLLM
ncbi:MAG: undecaprenyl-diphosphate phosphatase [Thermoplasmata archaeon]